MNCMTQNETSTPYGTQLTGCEMTTDGTMPEPYQRFIALLVKDVPCTCSDGKTCVATAVRDKLQTVWPDAWEWAQTYG